MDPGKKTANKRKEPPTEAAVGHDRAKKTRKFRDARTIASQASGQAFQNGQVDVAKFVKAREYEIRALQESMGRSKKGLNTRAFQHVPRDLRRRTASHNVKRVPKRLRARAAREMVDDNTPTVTARRRKPTSHMRLRRDTANRLRMLHGRARSNQAKSTEKVGATTHYNAPGPTARANRTDAATSEAGLIKAGKTGVNNVGLQIPPVSSAKFRSRQRDKTWLPTHMFHTKRAHMTPPKEPLWRFSIPMTPTSKAYRQTHRASLTRGAIAWDMSYVSTVGLQGPGRSIEGLLRALGIGADSDSDSMGCWSQKGQKWRDGVRTWHGWVLERDGWPSRPIAPVTIIWAAEDGSSAPVHPDSNAAPTKPKRTGKRQAIIRVHPSAFLQLWREVVQLSKVQKPAVAVEDLRFEMGSIEIAGPGSTEALVGVLHPTVSQTEAEARSDSPESVWPILAALTNPACLPKNALLAFSIVDPRLRHPPRSLPSQPGSYPQSVAQTLCDWPVDRTQSPPALFDRRSRLRASHSLPSQKSVNRRKSLADPGKYPDPVPSDPKIPILLYTSTANPSGQATWSLLLPWKCVTAVWYSLMHYPVSSGGKVRFGGLDERRQIAYESGTPWFPGDHPGTEAGGLWETQQRQVRKSTWDRHPKGKRIEWDSLNLGIGRKGEIGQGWACDWELLKKSRREMAPSQGPDEEQSLFHLPSQRIGNCLRRASPGPKTLTGALVTVRLTLVNRGISKTCARIYRLPSTDEELRRKWLAIQTSKKAQNVTRGSLKPPPQATGQVRRRWLAESLLNPVPAKPGEITYPAVPGEEDLIGFVTTGNFNLAEGAATAIGSILAGQALANEQNGGSSDALGAEREVPTASTLCIVRDAGQSVGRLARWEAI